METCLECGASVPSGDERCPSCGGQARAAERSTQRFKVLRRTVADDETASVDAPADDDSNAQVPAGTWASTSESPRKTFPETDTQRIRRLPTTDPLDRGEKRPDHTARVARVGTETRRGGALAIARAPEDAEPLRDAATQKEGRLVAFPKASESTPQRIEPSAQNTPPSSANSDQRPAWLASELLRERMPEEPYARVSRVLALALGAGGALFAAVFGLGTGAHLGIAGLLAAIAMSALAPFDFRMRAAAFAVLASIGLVVATSSVDAGPDDVFGLAALGTTLLAAAQLLRAIHRTSKFARAAMGLGIAVSAVWLFLAGGLDAMVVQGDEPAAWFDPAVRALLLVVLALSLLGFLDDTGNSGCHIWPWLVLGWSGVRAFFALADESTGSDIAILAATLFGAVAALGWMQVWATTPRLGPISK